MNVWWVSGIAISWADKGDGIRFAIKCIDKGVNIEDVHCH